MANMPFTPEPLRFFARLGSRLDTLLSKLIRVVDPPAPVPEVKPKEPLYPVVIVTEGEESMEAYLIPREFQPARQASVNISSDKAMAAALQKAGETWDPQFRLVDDSPGMDIDLTPLTLADILNDTKKDS